MKKLIYSIVLITIIFGCSQNYKSKTVQKPNILFIMMDDLGYGQFGIYNDTITPSDFNPYFVHLVDSLQGYSLDKALEFSKTAIPTLTSLAKSGVIFTNTFTSSNLCAPSRLGIATATLQNKWGIYTNTDCEEQGIIPGTHLAERLKACGYKTAHIGKWHIGRRNIQIINKVLQKHGIKEKLSYEQISENYKEIFKEVEELGYYGSVINEHNPLNNGFDYYFGYNNWASQYYNSTYVWENFEHAGRQKGYNTDVFTHKAMEFMGKQIKNQNPFYIQLHYQAVHDSLEPKAPPVYFDKFDSESYTLNNFFAHVYGVDYNVNRIIKFLKSKGQYENTLIIFASDNGAMCGGSYDGSITGSPLPGNTPFSGHKGNYYQGGIRVPLFFHWPNGIRKPAVLHQMVSTMDILPSAVYAGGGDIPNGIDGKNLFPLIQNPDNKSVHDHLIWSGIHSTAWGYLVTKSTKNHDTERSYAPPAWVIIQGDYLLRYTGTLDPGIYYDFMEGREPIIELFNIKKDPAELINLAGQMPGKIQKLSEIYFEETADFPSPVDWDKSKWEELVNSKELF